MPFRSRVSPAMAVVATGCILRVVLAFALPPECAPDDHFEPVQIILAEGRLPQIPECWECYQPPLYYLVAAGTHASVEVATSRFVAPPAAARAARKAVQLVSTVAGCLTLWLCLPILRSVVSLPPWREALAVGVVAFLPVHLYQSALETNDALTYLFATLAVLATLRAAQLGWPLRLMLLAGLGAGAAWLTKAYGLVTVVAISLSLAAAVWIERESPRQTPALPAPKPGALSARGARTRWSSPACRALVAFLAAALLVGCWQTVRTVAIFGRFHVDNFDFFDSPMRFQPPERVRNTSFLSLRWLALWRHPWVHNAHVDSLPTQLFARTWFDYEGMNTTLRGFGPWEALWRRCAERNPVWNRARWEQLLDYRDDEVPPAFALVARAGFAAGAAFAILLVVGLLLLMRRATRDPAALLLLIHAAGALAVPLVQTLRLPHFAAMKAAFALSAVSTLPVLLALVLRPRTIAAAAPARSTWRPALIVVAAAAALLVLLSADAGYVVLQLARTAAGPPAPG